MGHKWGKMELSQWCSSNSVSNGSQAGILQKVAKLTKGLVPIDPSRSDIKREKIAELRAGRASGVKGGEKWGPSVTSRILPRFLHFPSVTFAPFVTLGKVVSTRVHRGCHAWTLIKKWARKTRKAATVVMGVTTPRFRSEIVPRPDLPGNFENEIVPKG